jgi:hypothetical protein
MPEHQNVENYKENEAAISLEPWIKFLGQDASQIGVLNSKGLPHVKKLKAGKIQAVSSHI